MRMKCTGSMFCECIKCEMTVHGMDTNFSILKHNKSGLEYTLRHKQDKVWYLGCKDGRVPSGQNVYGDSAEEIAKGIDCTIIG